MGYDFSALLGPTLLTKTATTATTTTGSAGRSDTVGTLLQTSAIGQPAGRTAVMVYFSGGWCPPCRAFTPVLGQFHAAVGGRADIVTLSADRSEEAFAAYWGANPTVTWQAVPWADRARYQLLLASYEIVGIPALLVFDAATGALVTRHGVEAVTRDPRGLHFPYAPRSVRQVLADAGVAPLVKGRRLALFFDAPANAFRRDAYSWGLCSNCSLRQSGDKLWCPACPLLALCPDCAALDTEHALPNSSFAPFNAPPPPPPPDPANSTRQQPHLHQLRVVSPPDPATESRLVRQALLDGYLAAKARHEADDSEPAFEILMISFAKTPEDHTIHTANVPWLVVPFDTKFSTGFHLSLLYNVEYDVTAVVVLDEARNVINRNANLAIKKHRPVPFFPLKVVDLSESIISNNFDVYQKSIVVVFCESLVAATQNHHYNNHHFNTITTILNDVADFLYPSNETNGKLTCTVDNEQDFCSIVDGTTEPDFIFFTAAEQTEFTLSLRKWARLDAKETTPRLVVGNVRSGEFYTFPFPVGHFDGDNTDEDGLDKNGRTVVQVIRDFRSG
ncbi:hypothetical protein HK100_009186, partial [Physocladia obscura]